MTYKSPIHQILPLVLCTITALTGFAQNDPAAGYSFSRAEAEAYALEHSYGVRRSELEIDKARKIIYQNIALGMPQVSANGNLTDNLEIQQQVIDFGGTLTPVAFGVRYGAAAGINAEQLIFDGSYIVGLMATRVVRETAENNLEKTRIRIREEVAQAYHLVLTTDRALTIVRENLKFIQESLYQTRKLQEEGFLEQQDVDQLDLLVTNLETNVEMLERQSEISRTILKLRMGIPIGESIVLTDDVESLMLMAEDGTTLLNQEFESEQHIDYRSLATGIEGQKLTLRNEQMKLLPRLSAFYSYNHMFQSNDLDVLFEEDPNSFDFAFSSWGVRLTWSLFESGRRIAKNQEERIELHQLEVQREELTDALRLQFETARAEYSYALNNYIAQKKNTQIARNIRDRTAIKFSEGVSSSLEFTQAENQYQQSLSSLVNAAQTVLDKRVALESVTGHFNTNQ